MTPIDIAVAWAVATANDSSHGYDQQNRWSPDYDCSSFLITAWEEAGIPVKTNGATYTGNMCDAFIKSGFSDVTKQVNLSTGNGLQKGDILWVSGHTEMMCSSTQIVGATIAENGTIYADQTGDQTGQEIRIRDYYNKPWTRVLRHPSGSTDNLPVVSRGDVIASNAYLSLEQMKTNAIYIWQYLSSKGWSLNAVAGMLGNMQTESTINPNIWQNLDEGNTSLGYGLVQWTPATKLIEWCESNNLDYTDIDAQLERIIYEKDNNVQYIQTDTYPLSFDEFATSVLSPEYLAWTFLLNYERPAEQSQPDRATQARYWYDYLSNIDSSIIPQPSKKKKGLSLLMMYLATKR